MTGCALPGAFRPEGVDAPQVALPKNQGIWHRGTGGPFCFQMVREGHGGWSMPFFAVVGEREALLTIIEDEHDARIWFEKTADGRMVISAVQDPTRGSLRYNRSVLLRFVEPNLTAICQAYRQYVQDGGHFVSWDEKIEARPEPRAALRRADVLHRLLPGRGPRLRGILPPAQGHGLRPRVRLSPVDRQRRRRLPDGRAAAHRHPRSTWPSRGTGLPQRLLDVDGGRAGRRRRPMPRTGRQTLRLADRGPQVVPRLPRRARWRSPTASRTSGWRATQGSTSTSPPAATRSSAIIRTIRSTAATTRSGGARSSRRARRRGLVISSEGFWGFATPELRHRLGEDRRRRCTTTGTPCR